MKKTYIAILVTSIMTIGGGGPQLPPYWIREILFKMKKMLVN